MRGAALPAALLFAALGLMLAFVPRRAIFPAILIAAAIAFAVASLAIPKGWIEIAFVGCWASVILLGGSIHLRRIPLWLALLAAADVGLWAGAVIAGEGTRADLIRAIPAILVCLPALVLARLGWQIAIKVVASWLIAIALLAALLPATPTPGYVADHMD